MCSNFFNYQKGYIEVTSQIDVKNISIYTLQGAARVKLITAFLPSSHTRSRARGSCRECAKSLFVEFLVIDLFPFG